MRCPAGHTARIEVPAADASIYATSDIYLKDHREQLNLCQHQRHPTRPGVCWASSGSENPRRPGVSERDVFAAGEE